MKVPKKNYSTCSYEEYLEYTYLFNIVDTIKSGLIVAAVPSMQDVKFKLSKSHSLQFKPYKVSDKTMAYYSIRFF